MYRKEQPKIDLGFYGPFKVLEKFNKEEEILLKIKDKFDELIERVEDKIVGKYYSKWEGRPAYPIKKMLGMLIIQRIYGINSDRVINRLCLAHEVFRYFIGCEPYDYLVPDDTTLVKFRKRLGEDGFREIFNELVKLADEAKLISKLRILDATYINALGKKFGIIKFVREGINRVIKEVLRKNEEFAKKLKMKFQNIKIKTKEKAKELGKKFVEEIAKLKELPAKTKQVISAMELSLAGEPMVNFVDVEARWGYKNKDFSFGGYKGEIATTETGFITSFRTLPGNVNEGCDISPLIEDEKRRGIKPQEVCGDGLYSSGKNLNYLKKEGIKGYFPKRTKSSNIDKFQVDGEKVICPMGKEAIGSIIQHSGKLFYWPTSACSSCPNKGKCLSPTETRKRVFLSDLKAMKLEERKDKLKNRGVIERVFAHGVIHGMRDTWYKGLSKTSIHLAIIFTLLNLEYLSNL